MEDSVVEHAIDWEPELELTIKVWYGVGQRCRLGPFRAALTDLDEDWNATGHIYDPLWEQDPGLETPWDFECICPLAAVDWVPYDDFCWEPDDGEWPGRPQRIDDSPAPKPEQKVSPAGILLDPSPEAIFRTKIGRFR